MEKYYQVIKRKLIITLDEIKGKKSTLELKMSSEQNRVLLGNIRPSFYMEKNEAPTMAEYDEVVKSSSTFIKKKGGSITASLCLKEGKKEVAPIIIKFKDDIGVESFTRIRDLFEHYSAISGRLHYMDGHEYYTFMKENDIYSEKANKTDLELLFSKNNKSKESIIFLIF